ncbi:hypothetical protein, partial [Arthrobacter sedimenti]
RRSHAWFYAHLPGTGVIVEVQGRFFGRRRSHAWFYAHLPGTGVIVEVQGRFFGRRRSHAWFYAHLPGTGLLPTIGIRTWTATASIHNLLPVRSSSQSLYQRKPTKTDQDRPGGRSDFRIKNSANKGK